MLLPCDHAGKSIFIGPRTNEAVVLLQRGGHRILGRRKKSWEQVGKVPTSVIILPFSCHVALLHHDPLTPTFYVRPVVCIRSSLLITIEEVITSQTVGEVPVENCCCVYACTKIWLTLRIPCPSPLIVSSINRLEGRGDCLWWWMSGRAASTQTLEGSWCGVLLSC